MKTFKIIFLGVVITIVVLIGGIAALLSSETVRQWIYKEGIHALADKLDTRIKVGKVSVNFSHGGVALYGFEMDDRSHVTMLKVDTLVVGMKWLPLLHKEVDIDAIYLHGVKAVLYKEHPDTAANYQFVVDAFKPHKDKTAKKKAHALELTAHLKTFDVSRADFTWDVKSMPHKGEGKLDGNHLAVRDYHVKMSGDLESLPEGSAPGKVVADPFNLAKRPASFRFNGKVTIEDFGATEVNSGAKVSFRQIKFNTKADAGSEAEWNDLEYSLPGKKFTRLKFKNLKVVKGGDLKDMDQETKVSIHGLNLWTDNHKPRKNVIKPRRGAFDAGHMNSDIDAEITVHNVTKYTVSLTVDKMTMYDKDSGLDIKNMTCEVFKNGDDIFLSKTKIDMAHTHLKMQTAHIVLDRGKADSRGKSKVTGITIKPFLVTADVILKDISKPFAPILSNFTTPLKLRVTCCGNLDRILFKNILVTGLHKGIVIHAQGDLCDVTKKKLLTLHFWDISMTSRGSATKNIVGNFKKKTNLKMQRQMDQLGDIRYKGKFSVVYKKVFFSGTLFTKFGDASFDFCLNGFVKRMIGTFQTTGFEIGKLMNIKRLGSVSVKADYDFVTAKPKKLNPQAKGKLPQGTLYAKIDGAKFGILSLKHITCDLRSDGKTAKGVIVVKQKLRDLVIDVEYHQTANDQSYKYKVRLQKISDEDKAARKVQRQEEKAAHKAEKAAKKAEKAAQKAKEEAEEAEQADNGDKPKKKKKFLGLF